MKCSMENNSVEVGDCPFDVWHRFASKTPRKWFQQFSQSQLLAGLQDDKWTLNQQRSIQIQGWQNRKVMGPASPIKGGNSEINCVLPGNFILLFLSKYILSASQNSRGFLLNTLTWMTRGAEFDTFGNKFFDFATYWLKIMFCRPINCAVFIRLW